MMKPLVGEEYIEQQEKVPPSCLSTSVVHNSQLKLQSPEKNAIVFNFQIYYF